MARLDALRSATKGGPDLGAGAYPMWYSENGIDYFGSDGTSQQ